MPSRAICPSCEGWVAIPNNPRIGQQVMCRHCETDLEIIEISPVELDWVNEDDDDWDDDWDDDDDDDDWDS